ncbi:MAG: hypothetical protein RLZZ175_1700 [Bacteroidota bacterium]|jgi:TonB family protein
MKYIVILLLFFSVNVFGQSKNEIDDHIFIDDYSQHPVFKGGYEPMKKFIDSIMVYPKIGIEKKIEGKVWIMFSVTKTGKLTNIKVVRSFSSENIQVDSIISNQFDNEALRIVKLMPDWIPGEREENIPVDVPKVVIPILFRLRTY